MTHQLSGMNVRSRAAERFRRLGVGQKVYLMLVTLLVIAAILSTVVVRQMQIALESNVADRKTDQELVEAFRLDRALTTMEAGVRGYARTGGAEFLGQYRVGKTEFAQSMERILTLEQDPSNRDLLTSIQGLADQQDEIHLRPLVALRDAAAGRATLPIADNLDSTWSIELRDRIDAYIAHEVADSRESQEVSDAAIWTLALVIFAAILATAGSLIPAGIVIGRSLSRRVRVVERSARSVAEGALDAAFPFPPGGDEIDSMARSIKRMADAFRDRIASESAARETAEQATRSRDEFFRRASHELRTPLNAILGFSELLQERVGVLGEREARYLGNLREAGARLHTLLEQVLALAELSSGPAALHLQPVDLAELLRSSTRGAAEQCAATGIRFDTTVPDRPVAVRADVTRLSAALVELAEQAVRSTAPGGTVSLGARVDGQILTVEVFNSGVVPDSDSLGRWFDPFPEQFAKGAHTAQPTRVGRAFARRVVELHGGSVVAEGLRECGTVIRIALPLANTSSGAAAASFGAGRR